MKNFLRHQKAFIFKSEGIRIGRGNFSIKKFEDMNNDMQYCIGRIIIAQVAYFHRQLFSF